MLNQLNFSVAKVVTKGSTLAIFVQRKTDFNLCLLVKKLFKVTVMYRGVNVFYRQTFVKY